MPVTSTRPETAQVRALAMGVAAEVGYPGGQAALVRRLCRWWASWSSLVVVPAVTKYVRPPGDRHSQMPGAGDWTAQSVKVFARWWYRQSR